MKVDYYLFVFQPTVIGRILYCGLCLLLLLMLLVCCCKSFKRCLCCCFGRGAGDDRNVVVVRA